MFMPTPRTFEKVLMDLIRLNMFKKCGQNGQKPPETHDNKSLDPQNHLFYIKDKNLYIPNLGHMFMPTPGTFEKSFNGSDKTNM